MKKNKKYLSIALVIFLISIIGLAFYLVPLSQTAFTGLGSEEDLYYAEHNPGTCFVKVRDSSDVLRQYEIDVNIRASGNEIIKTFDGTPNLPISYEAFFGENGCQAQGLTYLDYPNFWDLIKTGSIERRVDYCPFGVSDPTPFDGVDNFKCTGVCIPESSICTNDLTLKKCRADGNSIETIDCSYRCENGACLDADYNLEVTTDKTSYILGDDIIASGKFSQPISSAPAIEGVLATIQIIKNGAVIKEVQKYTDSSGELSIIFEDINLVGEADIKISLTYQGKIYTKSKPINIAGELIDFKVTTFSYTQYETEPIRFNVEMKDSLGRDIYPDKLTNLKVVSSLTSGTISTSSVEYKGEAEYEAVVDVSGVGRFVGKLSFNYEGTPYDSPIIEIDVEKIKLSIDTSEIVPVATLGENSEYLISIYDSLGSKITPDNLWIEIDFPDGVTKDKINFEDFTKISEGEYKFYYNFPDVEKFTFHVLADKEGYVRGSATASVAVSGEKSLAAGPAWIGSLIWIIPLAIVVFFSSAFLFLRRLKKK